MTHKTPKTGPGPAASGHGGAARGLGLDNQMMYLHNLDNTLQVPWPFRPLTAKPEEPATRVQEKDLFGMNLPLVSVT